MLEEYSTTFCVLCWGSHPQPFYKQGKYPTIKLYPKLCLFFFTFNHMCLRECVRVYTGAYGVQKRRLDPLELELLEVLTTRQTSVRETDCGPLE